MDKNLKISSNLLEPMILAYSRMNPSFLLKVGQHLFTGNYSNKSYFNDEKYQRLFNIIYRLHERIKSFPKRNSLKIVIDKLEKDKEMNFLLKAIVDKIFEMTIEDIDEEFLEEEVLNFIKEAKVYEAIIESQPDIESKNFGSIVKRIEDAVKINFDKDLGLSLLDVDESLSRIKRLDEEKSLSTGFSHMDDFLDGGLHPKEIYTVSGTPGIGKTLFLGNMALNIFLNGGNVLVYTFETSSERLIMRYFSNLAKMSKKEIIISEDTLKEKIKNLSTTRDLGRLVVKEYNANEVCSHELIANISDLQSYKDFKPDVIFVDYILIMATNDKSLSSSESYKYYKTVTEELRNIAKTLYIPVVTACQINREGMGDRGGSKANVTSKNISESRGIYDTTDVFWVMRQTPNDKGKNQFQLLFDKNRNERTGQQVTFDVDYEHMKIIETGSIGI